MLRWPRKRPLLHARDILPLPSEPRSCMPSAGVLVCSQRVGHAAGRDLLQREMRAGIRVSAPRPRPPAVTGTEARTPLQVALHACSRPCLHPPGTAAGRSYFVLTPAPANPPTRPLCAPIDDPSEFPSRAPSRRAESLRLSPRASPCLSLQNCVSDSQAASGTSRGCTDVTDCMRSETHSRA